MSISPCIHGDIILTYSGDVCPLCALEKREAKADKKAKQQDLEIAELKHQRHQLRLKLADRGSTMKARE